MEPRGGAVVGVAGVVGTAGTVAVSVVVLVGALASPDRAWAQVQAPADPLSNPLNEDALRPAGQHVIPLFDGWFRNADGGYTLCFGYFNLNTEESLDIPLGPLNRIEPVRYDGRQPTHFDPVPDPELTSKYRHHWCVFTVDVPDGFDGDVVWTLTSRGDPLAVPGGIIPEYILDEPTSPGRYAEAPWIRLSEEGERVRGRRGVWEGRERPRSVRFGEPLSLTVWVEHPEPGTWLGWSKHQGPGEVIFSADEVRMEQAEGSATVRATFDAPGRYVLRVQAINDPEISGNPTYGFEFHCCWTNGYVEVEVRER